MNFFRMCIIVLSLSLLSACVFFPKTSPNQYDGGSCGTVTKKLRLEVKVKKKYSICSTRELKKSLGICLVLSGIAASATAVVSGSVVLLGNTIHWVEHKARCD